MLVISNITISNFSLLQAFSWSGRYILPYILEIFPSKFTIEKIVLNKKNPIIRYRRNQQSTAV